MNMTSTDATATEADENQHETISTDDPCPSCGRESLYREPMVTHGAEDEVTSGVACSECSWSRVDRRENPNATNAAGVHPDKARERREARRRRQFAEPCPNCGELAEMVYGTESPASTPFVDDDEAETYEELTVHKCDCVDEFDGDDGYSCDFVLGHRKEVGTEVLEGVGE